MYKKAPDVLVQSVPFSNKKMHPTICMRLNATANKRLKVNQFQEVLKASLLKFIRLRIREIELNANEIVLYKNAEGKGMGSHPGP